MAGATAAEGLHRISAAIPLRIMVKTRFIGSAIYECGIPESKDPALIERKWQSGLWGFMVDSLYAVHEIRV